MPSATYDHLKIPPLPSAGPTDSSSEMPEDTTKSVVEGPTTSQGRGTDENNQALVRAGPSKQQVRVQLVETSDNPSGVALVDPYRTNKCQDATDLVELARQIQSAEEFVRARAHGRLGIIADQMRHLQQQAAKVLGEAKRDDQLHHLACNMVKKPGNIYYWYKRSSGQDYLSLISPDEWGAGLPHEYIGAYRLEADNSWTPYDDIKDRNADIEFLDSILRANKTLIRSIQGPMNPQIAE